MRSAALLALASTLLYGAANTATSKKTAAVRAAKSKSATKAATKSGSKVGASRKRRTGAKSRTVKSASRKSTTKSGKSTKAAYKRRKGSHAATSAATWRSRQLAPTPERYKEIQAALVERGYLKKDASGVWDTDSADALRRFQQDQSLDATGKLDSLSLIALGLGPKHAAASAAPPTAPHAPAPQNPPATAPPAPAPDTPPPSPTGPAAPSIQP